MKHSRNPVSDSISESADLTDIDFAGAERIEISGDLGRLTYSNLQYFSDRKEFEDRLGALMSWADKAGLSTIYGIISIKTVRSAENVWSSGASREAIAQFESFFVKNIRVPKKFTPPGKQQRRSDGGGHGSIKGNFDLVCRTPSKRNNPHLLEFVLFDCEYEDAAGKVESFKEFAHDLQLNIECEIRQYNKAWEPL